MAVGDFAGNVIVWDVGSHLPLASARVPSLLPVRSICWRRPTHRPDGPAPHVLIGCVSGDIYAWNPLQPGSSSPFSFYRVRACVAFCLTAHARIHARIHAHAHAHAHTQMLRLCWWQRSETL